MYPSSLLEGSFFQCTYSLNRKNLNYVFLWSPEALLPAASRACGLQNRSSDEDHLQIDEILDLEGMLVS